MTFFKAMAMACLGRRQDALALLTAFEAHAKRLESSTPVVGFFATSLPDFRVFRSDLVARDRLNAKLFQGFARLGLGDRKGAEDAFSAALCLEPTQLDAGIGVAILDEQLQKLTGML